jgi:nickel-dependent lactate racemase
MRFYLNHQRFMSPRREPKVQGLEELLFDLNRIGSPVFQNGRSDDSAGKVVMSEVHVRTHTAIQIDCYGTEGKTMDKIVGDYGGIKCPALHPQSSVHVIEMRRRIIRTSEALKSKMSVSLTLCCKHFLTLSLIEF